MKFIALGVVLRSKEESAVNTDACEDLKGEKSSFDAHSTGESAVIDILRTVKS